MPETPEIDPVFREEQSHLAGTYAKLKDIQHETSIKLHDMLEQAIIDKDNMLDELTLDFGNDVNLETYVEIESMHKIMDAYNQFNDVNAERLRRANLLLRQPYFAKVSLQFKPGAPARDIYIGSAGMTDENYRHFIVDWRSPVAETYYNQDNGRTSYQANGRTITADLKLRRQFDIEGNTLNAYFDTTVAIQDPLLLASLSKQRSDRMTAITATIQKEQNQVVRHEDVPALLVNGIAGSGKTSVLLQRIAYLFYQKRETLDPSQVFLITPNSVFQQYIDNVPRDHDLERYDGQAGAGRPRPGKGRFSGNVACNRRARRHAAVRPQRLRGPARGRRTSGECIRRSPAGWKIQPVQTGHAPCLARGGGSA